MPRPKITVVGSLNVDYIAAVERLPAAGETVAATQFVRRFGGKGANQAIAAARQGAIVSLIGRIGADEQGRAYRKRLREEGIGVAGVSATTRAPTGTAFIAVDRAAENIIVVAAGANGELKPAAIRAQRARIALASLLLLQLEIPLSSVLEAIRIANRAGVPVVLNPSPLRKDFPWAECHLDTLIVNAGEAQAIFGIPFDAASVRGSEWRRCLAQKRVERLIITRGANPSLCISEGSAFEVPAFSVKPVDTVGAGDAFAGTFAAQRADGADIPNAIRSANCAGALATLKQGAQEALPGRIATESFLRGRTAAS